ncbi:MAG: O-antigen ligase domain-containing protein [Pelagibacteraceae bacterium TMED124]|nr:hypothetical protein [Candidatus Neomarinimicrobiota bacterium]RPG17198.1 MAG: O-antigen ligase domain-containing protein [Pelagibacteraceae bacterium TMED124]|tara:strand:+ start:3388 stop:4677 length:1290 start_codon:yes stop_codon:yes gene_type:complete
MLYLTKKLNFNLAELIIISFPLLFLSGPFLTDLAVIIIDLIFLKKIYRSEINLYIDKKIIYFSLFFFGTLIVSALNSSDVSFYLIETLPLIRFILFPIAICHFLNEKISNVFINIILIIFFFLFLDVVFQILNGQNIFGYDFVGGRPTSVFKDEQILGSYVLRNLIIAIPIFFIASNKINRKILIIILISTILIILSKERVPTFYLLLYLLIIFFNIYLFTNKKKILIFKTIIFSFFVMIFLYFLDGPQLKKRFDHTVNAFLDKELPFNQNTYLKNSEKTFQNFYVFSAEHENYILTSFNIFKSNFLTGTGVKSFRHMCKKDVYKINKRSCNTHPHNTFVQLLTEVGILGTIPIFLVLIFSLIHFVKIFSKSFFGKKTNFNNIYFITPTLISLFPFVPSGNIFNNYLASYYAFSVGIFLYYMIGDGKTE